MTKPGELEEYRQALGRVLEDYVRAVDRRKSDAGYMETVRVLEKGDCVLKIERLSKKFFKPPKEPKL